MNPQGEGVQMQAQQPDINEIFPQLYYDDVLLPADVWISFHVSYLHPGSLDCLDCT
jgi:hypothetical protein